MQASRFIIPIFLITLVFSCKEKEEKKEEVLRPVKYHVVGTAAAQKYRTFSGVAKAGNEIELSFRSTGIVAEVNVKVGQRVKKGALIAKLDNIEANLAYEKSISALNAAQSDLNTAKTELDRIKSLYEKRSVSLSDYQGSKNVHQNAKAQFESAQRNKSLQKQQIEYGFIYAPSDGVIASKQGKVNENVQAGHVFAVLNAGQGMKVGLGLPEGIINDVQTGMGAKVEFSVLDQKSFKGNVTEVSPVVDPEASTYPVEIEIIDPSEAIKPGMAANVTFNFENDETTVIKTLVVPLKAVGEDGNGNFVFILKSEDGITGQAKKQRIEVGNLTPQGFEVKSGLVEGEYIATAGLQTLLDGQKISLQ